MFFFFFCFGLLFFHDGCDGVTGWLYHDSSLLIVGFSASLLGQFCCMIYIGRVWAQKSLSGWRARVEVWKLWTIWCTVRSIALFGLIYVPFLNSLTALFWCQSEALAKAACGGQWPHGYRRKQATGKQCHGHFHNNKEVCDLNMPTRTGNNVFVPHMAFKADQGRLT